MAEKRRAEIAGGSLAAQVARTAALPVQHCLLAGDLNEAGMATLILARGATPYSLTLGGFLIDAWLLGVKDTFFQTASAECFESLVAGLEDSGTVQDIDPAYARKLLRNVTAWAASNGVAPHRDFTVVEKLFGDVDADASDATFAFGLDGKPAYISGPDDSPAQSRFGLGAIREAIAKRLGGALAGENGQ